jgi:hypothetical protein
MEEEEAVGVSSFKSLSMNVPEIKKKSNFPALF